MRQEPFQLKVTKTKTPTLGRRFRIYCIDQLNSLINPPIDSFASPNNIRVLSL